MKYSIRKMIAALMVFVLLLHLSPAVCGTATADQVVGIPADQVVEEDTSITRNSFFFPDLYENGGIPLTLKHTLTATGVKNMLRSSTKIITRGNLPSDAKKIYITGLLTHSGFSTGTTDVIRTGLCYQDTDTGLFIPEYYEHVLSATNFTEIICAVSSLNVHVTYYPFIKNLEPGSGTVSGNVGFYYSKV